MNRIAVQSGQALVLVLLSLAVVLTLVLFVLARSTTDIAVSSRSEEATRAFSVAEAGIENALVIGEAGSVPQIGDAQYSANVSNFAEGSPEFNYPIEMSSGDSTTVWFVSHDSDGNLVCNSTDKPCFRGNRIKVCWGKPGTSPNAGVTPAIEVSVFYEVTPGDPSTIRIGRGVYDPYSSRTPPNSFYGIDAGTCTISGVTYAFQRTIRFPDVAEGLKIPPSSFNFPNGLKFARFRMFYNTNQTHNLGISTAGCVGCSMLPSQGLDIISTGSSGEANRRVQVFQAWPEPPSVLDYAIYSGQGITK